MAGNADREFVAKNINLAAKLSDGQKIYIPRVGEGVQPQPQTVTAESPQGNLININSASAGELDSLPGVGSVTAQKIINNRLYSQTDDLLNKKVVSSKVFGEIKDKITAY